MRGNLRGAEATWWRWTFLAAILVACVGCENAGIEDNRVPETIPAGNVAAPMPHGMNAKTEAAAAAAPVPQPTQEPQLPTAAAPASPTAATAGDGLAAPAPTAPTKPVAAPAQGAPPAHGSH
jgi:hypothetical protein